MKSKHSHHTENKTQQEEEQDAEEGELDDYKLGHKVKQRMKKEWLKRYKGLKKATKNKEISVTMIQAMGIIKKFVRKRRERKMREALIAAGKLPQPEAEETQKQGTEVEKTDQLMSFIDGEDRNTHRQLNSDANSPEENKVDKVNHFDEFAVEMDLVMEKWQQHQLTNEDYQQMRNSVMTPASDFRRSQQKFGVFNSELAKKREKLINESRSKNVTTIKQGKSEFQADEFGGEEFSDRMTPTEQITRQAFLRDLEELNENEIAAKIEKELHIEQKSIDKQMQSMNSQISHDQQAQSMKKTPKKASQKSLKNKFQKVRKGVKK